MTINITKLKCGAELIWSIPLSGFGHVADEQPLPYIHYKGLELTPRYGGEEIQPESSIESLPLPYGKLKNSWPFKQRLFNFTRRKVNIYWRNIFTSFSNKDMMFYLLEQLKFTGDKNGFVGVSPMLVFSRVITPFDDSIIVKDKISFLKEIEFEYFHFSPYAELLNSTCEIQTSRVVNNQKEISSSTGKAVWRSELVKDIKFKAGEEIEWQYLYQIKC
ncbi:hypothetical protein ACPF34_002541 [Vibrio cholerae]